LDFYLPIAEMSVNLFLILGMGAAVGFVSGLFGVGGGFLMTPLLIFVGVSPAIAVGSVSAQIAATSVSGVLSYHRRRAVDYKLGFVLVVGGLMGTVAGIWFFTVLRRAGQLDLFIVVSYVALFWTIGGLMLFETLRTMLRKQPAGPVVRHKPERPWYFALPFRLRFHRSKIVASAIPVLGVAFLIGFAGAVLGIGGGFILVPALIYIFHVPTAVVIGTSMFQILFTMLAATIMHAVTSQSVDIMLAIALIVGGVIGSQFGTRAGQNLHGETFRLMLAVLILVVGFRFAAEIMIRPQEPFSTRFEDLAQ
jgi:hypothetical protein